MKFKLLATLAGFLKNLTDAKEIPIENAKVNFSEDDKNKIKSALPEGMTYEEIEKALNKEIQDVMRQDSSNEELEKVKKELKDFLASSGMSEKEIQKLSKDSDDKDPSASELASTLKELKDKQDQLIEKLMNDDEPDTPLATHQNPIGMKVIHSNTHLYASNKQYDAFEGRNWNKRAAGLISAATNFTDSATIEKLDGDLQLYFRENPEEIKSLHRDNFGLPAHWPKRMRVDDKVADGTIVSAEITQARKLPWLPKNKQLIKPEEGKIYPVQIDIEFVGYFLQKIEASWLNKMNKEGSQPYKESFVRFLVAELDKKARVEDRISSINGVYVETPENSTIPGRFINRQHGLLYQVWKARNIDKKYRPFSAGIPTAANIVTYIDEMIQWLPYDVRMNPDIYLYLSPYWLKAYKRRYEATYGTNSDYDGYPNNPKDYPNITFEPLIDLEGKDFMFFTLGGNIEILENIPAEKSMYRFEYLKRMIYIWADYKLGIRFIHIGNKVAPEDPDEFKVQTVWSNDVPIFKDDFFIPVFDDATGEISAYFNNLEITDTWNTNITSFINTHPGQVIRVRGNTQIAAARNIVNNANINLAEDAAFNLQSGGTLTLYVLGDGTLVELARTTEPETANTEDSIAFTEDIIDAKVISAFNFRGNADTALAGIINGVDGKIIRIYGTDTADVEITISNVAENINVNSDAVLNTSTNYIELVKVSGVWLESHRSIA